MDFKQQIKMLKTKAKVNFSPEEELLLEQDLKEFIDALELFEKINTKNIDEIIFPLDNVFTTLREDEYEPSSQETILKNSQHNKNDFFILKDEVNENKN